MTQKRLQFTKRDLEIIESALAFYESGIEDNEELEDGSHTNNLYDDHLKTWGDPDATLNRVRLKVQKKLQTIYSRQTLRFGREEENALQA